MRKKIVTIGGGSGSFNLLKGLKKYVLRDDGDESIDITFIAASTDSGGSSGELRDEFGILPPGDMRQGLIALSNSGEEWKKIFGYRFKNEKSRLNGHNIGNIIITGLTEDYGEKEAWNRLHKMLDVQGRVIPSTWEKTHITAEYEDGTVLDKEHMIDKADNSPLSKIKKLYSNSKIRANPEALEAIAKADAIIIGPGDLYTSIICNFVVGGIADAIKKSKAMKVYNCNIMTKPSETPKYSVATHFSDIEKYLGKDIISTITYNNNYDFDSKLLQGYRKENKEIVKFNAGEFASKNVKLMGADLASDKDIIRHDSEKLSSIIMRVIFPIV
ncbi:MAG: gluconeogenesis factor YvcK family protein [archaeon]